MIIPYVKMMSISLRSISTAVRMMRIVAYNGNSAYNDYKENFAMLPHNSVRNLYSMKSGEKAHC